MQLLNNNIRENIREFRYKESYADCLSPYHLSLNASPMELPRFNKATIPLASVNVEQGQSDTLYAQWEGNKYAANTGSSGKPIRCPKPTTVRPVNLFIQIYSILVSSFASLYAQVSTPPATAIGTAKSARPARLSRP